MFVTEYWTGSLKQWELKMVKFVFRITYINICFYFHFKQIEVQNGYPFHFNWVAIHNGLLGLK